MFCWAGMTWNRKEACWDITAHQSGPYDGSKPVPMKPPIPWAGWVHGKLALFLTSHPAPQRRRIIWDSMHASRHWDVWETLTQGAPRAEIDLELHPQEEGRDNGTA
jgi:hypothetical protein